MRGRDHFVVAWWLTAGAWAGCALLQLFLYLRPSPYGGPFLLNWKTFIIRPFVYELLSTWLIALPFLLLFLILYLQPADSPRWRIAHWMLIAVMAVNLLVTAFDHELYRFLGLRLGPNFLDVYADPSTLADGLFLNILARDKGGAFLSPILCLAAPALYLWWAARILRRSERRRPWRRWRYRTAAAILILPLGVGFTGYSLAHAKFRLSRLEPASFAIARDFAWKYGDEEPPGDPLALGRAWQAQWLADSNDRNWHFPDPERPYIREPTDPSAPAPEERWNIIMIQMESVRGVDTGHLRSGLRPSPTPYLDALAKQADAAVWTRALSFGPPSINGRFALQCSITPSSRRFITSQTRTTLYCLPDALRRQGYRTEMFSAGDIDMDNSTVWVLRMYDKLWRYPEEGQRDRQIFRHAASRIRELGRQGPFMVTLISASNHHPFHSPEPELDIAGHDTVQQRIRNTARYTDDVVRELVESLRPEPWFDRTLIVINSDHGYNLGEHGGLTGGYSLYRESTWMPLLIVGPHPRLPTGRHSQIVTLLDLAPTLADLVGLRERNPWQGHSLLSVAADRSIKFGFRDSLLAEAGEWSAVTDPTDGRSRLYNARDDWLQHHNLNDRYPEVAAHMLAEAHRSRQFNDWLLRYGKIWEPDR